MRRQWSCWRRPRTAWSWWCATRPRCWRRWRLDSRNWEQPGAGNSSNCSSSSSNSSKLHSKIICRRWEDSLFFPKGHWQHPTRASRFQGSVRAASGARAHLSPRQKQGSPRPGDRDRVGHEPMSLMAEQVRAMGSWRLALLGHCWGWHEVLGCGQDGGSPKGDSQAPRGTLGGPASTYCRWAELILWYISTWFFPVKMHFENRLKALANSGATFQLVTLRSKATERFWLICKWKKVLGTFFYINNQSRQIRTCHLI